MRRIEESVLIGAPREVTWGAFTDLTCWADWNSVLTRMQPGGAACLLGGAGFSCCLRPSAVPIPFTVRVEFVDPPARLLWVASRWGVRGRHWFRFHEREGGALFSLWRLRGLARRFLADLKREAERRAAGSRG